MSGPSRRVIDYLTTLLKDTTARRYAAAQGRLGAHLTELKVDLFDLTEEELDYLLADYILDLKEAGFSKQVALDTVSSTVKAFAGRRRLRASLQVCDGWDRENPPVQAKPMPEFVAQACCCAMHAAGWHAEAALVLLCFCGLLRIGEGLALRLSDVLLPQTHGFGPAILILLRATKRGMPDSDKVILTAGPVVEYVVKYVSFQRQQHAFTDNMSPFCDSNYNRFAARLERTQVALGFEAKTFRSHSLRRGGATQLAMNGWGLKDLMLAGRWNSERSCRLYVMKGEVSVLRLRQNLDSAIVERLELLAALGPQIFEIVAA